MVVSVISCIKHVPFNRRGIAGSYEYSKGEQGGTAFKEDYELVLCFCVSS